MPAPGTRGKMPQIKKTVTGALRAKENTRDTQVRATVAKNDAPTAPAPKHMAARYTSQPTAPVAPVQSHSRRGVWKMMEKATVDTKATAVWKAHCRITMGGIIAAHPLS